MIAPEHIHDALTLLPEDLLTPVDALRQKKRVPWKSLTALAACLCLAVSLWLFFPGGIGMDNAGSTAEHAPAADGVCDSASQDSFITANVIEVMGDHITVLPGEKLPPNATVSIYRVITVRFDLLETVPKLRERQFIRLYFQEIPEISTETTELLPYRIEIIDN